MRWRQSFEVPWSQLVVRVRVWLAVPGPRFQVRGSRFRVPVRLRAVRAPARTGIAALIALAPAVEAAIVPNPAVAVRIYDASGLNARVMTAALDVAASILAPVSVDVTWKRCGESDVCQRPMASGELAIRFVRAAIPPDDRGALPLGDAMVDPTANGSVLATIYVDRVEWVAADSGHDAPSLLGRATAHELGHLLLASTSHSRNGLMRAVWSRDELRAGRPRDWTFAAPDVDAIQARLGRQRAQRPRLDARCPNARRRVEPCLEP